MHVGLPACDSVLLAYSGGKDSLASLDLCVRAGKRVIAVMFVLLPGLDYYRTWQEYAERTWGVEVRQYQSADSAYYLRNGICRFVPDPTVPPLKPKDIETAIRQDTGLEWIGYGYRKNDSFERRAMLGHDYPGGVCEKWHRFAPVYDWTTAEVLAYLSARRIADAKQDKKAGKCSGLSLLPQPMAWLRENWPDDYKRVLEVFPLAAAQADRAALFHGKYRIAKTA